MGAGGIVHGDISRTAGETDRVTIDLEAGATLRISLTATFRADLVLTDPEGAPVDLGFAGGTRLHTSITVASAGVHQLAIASADGSQGLYTLAAKPKWARTIPIAGTGEQVVEVAMPADSRIACRVVRAAGATGSPRIVRLQDPNGASLLASAVEPRGNVARLTPTSTSTAGVYHLTIAPTDGTSSWSGTLTRSVPPVRSTSLRLTNGLDAISFKADGVAGIFYRSCSRCHGWAFTYGGVRAYAQKALGRITSGSMPPGGGVSPGEVALIKAWIATGMRP